MTPYGCRLASQRTRRGASWERSQRGGQERPGATGNRGLPELIARASLAVAQGDRTRLQRVADHYVRRQTIQVHQTGAEIAWRASVPVDDMLAMSQTAILRLSDQPGARIKSSTAGEVIERWLEGFTADRPENDRGDRIVGHSTRVRCLDKITLGLQPARLYLLPAYTSVGKSQLAHQVALHVATHHGPVLMVSLEMSDQELTTRAIAMESGIPAEALATHEIDDREAAAVLEVIGRQQADPLHYMDGSDGLTTSQIRSRALQLQAQHGRLALIVIDYGQLLQDSKGNNSTVEDQTLVSRNLKRMARALDVPLLVPVQINRQAGSLGGCAGLVAG
jgi:replicative DNA helicase